VVREAGRASVVGTMVVWCSCTWDWCKRLRDENKVESTQHFLIPRSEHITDPDEKLSA